MQKQRKSHPAYRVYGRRGHPRCMWVIGMLRHYRAQLMPWIEVISLDHARGVVPFSLLELSKHDLPAVQKYGTDQFLTGREAAEFCMRLCLEADAKEGRVMNQTSSTEGNVPPSSLYTEAEEPRVTPTHARRHDVFVTTAAEEGLNFDWDVQQEEVYSGAEHRRASAAETLPPTTTGAERKGDTHMDDTSSAPGMQLNLPSQQENIQGGIQSLIRMAEKELEGRENH